MAPLQGYSQVAAAGGVVVVGCEKMSEGMVVAVSVGVAGSQSVILPAD